MISRECLKPATIEIINSDLIHKIDDFRFEDIKIHDYQHHAFIRAPMAI